eukprot:Skav202562  [mRNA]  locus=scaffold2177:162995:163225:+ [translate_table: standard]
MYGHQLVKSCFARNVKGSASMASVMSPHPSSTSTCNGSPKPRALRRWNCDLPSVVPMTSSKAQNNDDQTLGMISGS